MYVYKCGIKIVMFVCMLVNVKSKYIEGEIKSRENWVFLTRFCFLSEKGEFEYNIEFNEKEGNLNLLMYYDTEDQWPAVYKTNKTCYQKESVLDAGRNQIINLTTKHPYYREQSGCVLVDPINREVFTTTELPEYTQYDQTTTTQKILIPDYIFENGTSDIKDMEEFNETYNIASEDLLNNSSDKYQLFENSSDEILYNLTDNYDSTSTTVATLKRSKRLAVNKDRLIICQNGRRFRSSRARWWFVAISNCNGTKGIHLRYKILMTNGHPGDYWHHHFSADEFYILPVLLAFCIAYSLLLFAIIMCSMELKSRQLLHSTYKLFVFSSILQFFGVLLQNAAYLKYAVNGIGSHTVKMFGAMLMGCSETCFLLLLLLLAKGYTVTRGRLPLSGSVKLTIFMCLYFVTYICIFVYEAKVFDPGEVLYLYESPAGYGLIALRVAAWLMFIYSTVITLKHYPEKAYFYYPFNICGTLWFIAGPAFILSANTYIDKWVRESVVCAVLLLITFGGHLNFLILTMPSLANKNFPYHVRTSQIGVMEVTGTSGSSTIEHFSHHIYEPTTNINGQETVIIPLTKRTEEIFSGIYNQHLNSNFELKAQANTEANHVEPEDIQNISMENVLTWALAKNCNLHNLPEFEKKSNSESLHCSKDVSPVHQPESGYNSGNVQENNMWKPYNYDYVKDVPLELFTVSKMAVKRSNSTGEAPNNTF